jgi:SAM-dependent methyltransferase
VENGAGKARKKGAVDDAVLQDAVQQFVRSHDEEMRQLVASVIASMPELERLVRFEHVEDALKRLVKTELASRLSERSPSPARTLALFESAGDAATVGTVREHADSKNVYLPVPETVLGQPLRARIGRDTLPLPATHDREGYHADRHFDYWLSGLEDFARVCAAIERHGRRVAAPFAMLDFGCASGRVLRHFLCQLEGLELWGADLNERHVDWLLRHFPRAIRAFQCTTLPSLPLPDGGLDLVTAFSVFTHIDEYEIAWLLELRRVLRPGGFAYLTIHSDDTWHELRPGIGAYDNLWRLRDVIPEHTISPELFQQPMPKDKTVFRWRSAEVNNTNVFLSKRWIHDVWGRFFEVLEILPQSSGYQDVVVLRKPF